MAKGLICSPVQVKVLQALINGGEISNIAQLADRLSIHRPSASRAIHSLIGSDLVEQTGRTFKTTDKGVEACKSAIPIIEARQNELKLLRDELKRLRASYKQLETHAKWLDMEMTRALNDGGIKREWAYDEDHAKECTCGREVWPELETQDD